MVSESHALAHGAELDVALEREITQRTWGRIRQLRVEKRDGRLAVCGYTSSYYAKQLALAAVREVYPTDPVDLDIQVISGNQPLSARSP